jgi:hypothetical protein
MPQYRKPPVQTGGRPGSPMPSDENFSIETTTMRLKSLKLRRAEAADKALDAHLNAQKPAQSAPAPASPAPAGRVRHDERGMAVWDWAAAAGDTAALSATNLMRKLEVPSLSLEQTQRSLKALEIAARDAGGGGDPYNQRSGASGDPFKRAVAGGNPYDRGALPPPSSNQWPATGKKSSPSVLDQLTGKKK